MGIQFIGVSVMTGVILALVSFLWPKVTNKPRPEALTKVRDIAVQTPLGREVENILGEQTSNVSEAISSAASSAVNSVTSNAKQSVMQKMFNVLSEDEKASFRADICSPSAEKL